MGLIFGHGVAKANDVYIAQTMAGGNTGADCADALVYSYFNTSGNWTSGAPTGTKIGPGTTVHLCGTFTAPAGTVSYLHFQSGGSSTSPITLHFEADAVIQAPYWSNGSAFGAAIYLGSYGNLIVDGGTNGLIQATANGTNLANQVDYGLGVYSFEASNVTIKNLTVANIYVHSCAPTSAAPPVAGCPDEGGPNTMGIFAQGGSAVTLSNNVVHDAKWCLNYNYPGGTTNSAIVISNNNLFHCDHGVAIGDGYTGAVINGISVYGNSIHDGANWDDNGNQNHHDGIHAWTTFTGSSLNNGMFYDNYIFGNWGIAANSWMYFEGGSKQPNSLIFNNVIVDGGALVHYGAGYIAPGGTGASVYNNTVIGQGQNSGTGVGINAFGSSPTSVRNNVISQMIEAFAYPQGLPAMQDYNAYYAIGSNGWYLNNTLAQWQSACQCDYHSSVANPYLSGTYGPTSTSLSLIQAGTNLMGLAILPLDFDKAGNQRPGAAGSWDIGAYQYVAGPATPTNLTAISH